MYLRIITTIYSISAMILIKEGDGYRNKLITPTSDVMELATVNLTSLFDKDMEFIEERIAIINSELGSTENKLTTFKQRSGLTDLTSDAQIALQEKFRYEQQLAENATQLNLVLDLQNYLNDAKNVNEVIPSNIGLQDDGLKGLINQYNTLVIERKRLLRTSSENNLQRELPLFSVLVFLLDSLSLKDS